MLLTPGVLHTAITRARELLILWGGEDVVAHMTANDRQQRRYSGLRWFVYWPTGEVPPPPFGPAKEELNMHA